MHAAFGRISGGTAAIDLAGTGRHVALNYFRRVAGDLINDIGMAVVPDLIAGLDLIPGRQRFVAAVNGEIALALRFEDHILHESGESGALAVCGSGRKHVAAVDAADALEQIAFSTVFARVIGFVVFISA